MPIEVKNFATQADEAKDMPNARMEAVSVLGQRVMKLTLGPEWKWSTDIKPIVGTPSCQATHTGIIVEGTIHCVCDDGSEATYTAGDAYAISPNHDAWCVGGKRAVVYEFAGMWPLKQQHYYLYKDLKVLKSSHPEVRKIKRQQSGHSAHGNKVWRSSFVMLDYLETCPLEENSHALEIGCGWGLAGLYLKKIQNVNIKRPSWAIITIPCTTQPRATRG